MGSYKWGYKCRVSIVINHIRGLTTPLTPSRGQQFRVWGLWRFGL